MSLWNQPDGVEESDDAAVDIDSSRLEMGIEILDGKLGGGVQSGSIVALTGSPAGQSEQFLDELARTRPTLYVTTDRSEASVRETLSEDNQAIVVELDAADPGYVLELASALPERSHLVVDHVGALERVDARERTAQVDWSHRDFLGKLREILGELDAVAYLHCLDGRATPDARDTTYHLADAVFELTTRREGDAVEHLLTVPKYRGGSLDDVIRLDMRDGVDVDFSRNIV